MAARFLMLGSWSWGCRGCAALWGCQVRGALGVYLHPAVHPRHPQWVHVWEVWWQDRTLGLPVPWAPTNLRQRGKLTLLPLPAAAMASVPQGKWERGSLTTVSLRGNNL